MPRKIFISFLGSTNYGKCHYIKASYKSNEVRYIQLATLEYIKAKDWSKADKAYILVTDGERGSYIKNWKDDGHINRDDKKVIKQTGLETELVKMKLSLNIDKIHIKDGNSEKEIWEIFETIYNLLDENDELYIDITHGFRYLPMLTIVLANYGKLLKNISIKSISYGNYESRNFQTNEAQIINLTSFSELQDWTNAANIFLNFGSTDSLIKLISDENIKNNLKKFSDAHNTARGKELFSGIIADELYKQINSVDLKTSPFYPIKNVIIEKLSEYSKGDIIKNGLAAVKYCIDFNLTQQGITILYEFIITYVLISIDEEWEIESNRNIASGCLNINNITSFNSKLFIKDNEEKGVLNIAHKIFNLPFRKKISQSIFKKLALGSRNDINHAGIRDNPKDSSYLIERLNDYYELLKEMIYQTDDK